MILNFGKYRGRSTEEIYRDDPIYVDWVLKTQSYNAYFQAAQNDFKKMRANDEQAERHQGFQTLPWFEVLEVLPDAPMDDIKKAWKKQVGLYHPDKVNGLGVELQELANRKTQEINAAYDQAQKERA